MMIILFLFSLMFLPNAIHSSVSFIRNPNCNDTRCQPPLQPALFYGKQIVSGKVNHMIYSSFDQLTIIIAQSDATVSPTFDYNAFFEGNYNETMLFPEGSSINSFVIVLRRLIEFKDSGDKGVMNDDSEQKSYYLTDLIRNNVTDDSEQPKFEYNINELGGTLHVDIVYPGEAKRDTKFPKLRTEPSSYYLNIVLKATNYSYDSSRFAFELYLMSPAKDGFKTTKTQFIDDQYTPGSFNVWELKSNQIDMYPSSMLWKPVSYLSDDRSVEDNSLMHVYDLQNGITINSTVERGMFLSLYRQPYVSAMKVSIGASGDGFFKKENYGFLQFTAGLDNLQPDATAQFVTIGVIVSFALPVLVGIIAVVLILKRRFSPPKPSDGYTSIVN